MIQRIQSVFLLVAAALQVLLFKTNFFIMDVNGFEVKYTAWHRINVGSNDINLNLVHIILQFALMAVTLFAIFKYKDRKQQMKLCLYLLLGSIVSFGFSLYNLFTTNYTEFHFSFGTYLMSLILMLYISAYFFIKKDDNLVKSADRLRE